MCSIPAYPWRRCCAPIPLSWRADCLHAHVGSLLLMHIEGLARAQGIANIISNITGSNERSCAFHEKNGFVLEDVRFYRKKYNGKSIGLPKLLWRPDFFIFFLK